MTTSPSSCHHHDDDITILLSRHRKELFIAFICLCSYLVGFSCVTRVTSDNSPTVS